MNTVVLSTYISKLPALVIECNLITKANPLFFEMTGYSESEIVGRSISDICKALKITPDLDLCNPDIEKKYYLFTKTLEYRCFTIIISRLPKKDRYIYVFKEKEKSRFKDNFKYLASVWDENIIGIGILSVPDFILLKTNDIYTNFYNDPFNSPGNALGKQIMDIDSRWSGSKIESMCQSVISKGKSEKIEEFKYTSFKNNTTYWDMNITPVFEDVMIKYIVISAFDVTEEVNEKRKVEKIMKMQEEFFTFIAHEFRTPLTTMSSTLQLLDLIYSNEMTPNIRKYINTIKRSTFQQLRLVNNLLDITRAEAGFINTQKKNQELVTITKSILESIRPFAKTKDLKLEFKTTFKEKQIALDDEKYERILLNLLSNAIKFTPEGKTIRIILSSCKGRAYVCIKDEGVGIPKDKQAVVFDRFGQSGSKRSRDGEGTGIGLYLVKLLVESMDGEIILNSEEDKGSSFIINLPDDISFDTDEKKMVEFTNNRLVQSLQMEFSSIYFSDDT